MKKLKNTLCVVASILCLLLPTVVHADTQGAITNAENGILKELQEGVTVKGKDFHFDQTDITQAENYLKVHDVSDKVAVEVANYLKQARTIIVDNAQNVDVQSVNSLKQLIKSLPRPVIDELKQIVIEIGKLLDLTVTFYRDGVTIVDSSGNPVYSTGNAIKQTGGNYTMSAITAGALAIVSVVAYFVARRREYRV
ncbi:cell wall protein [Enterococcus hirae]|uniref:cell wall protein n=1 Tax=Enterococcus hirae TaxID=1354 RepID=UPI0015F27F89|nr:cell wall protein [Enterococcus hirae]EMF0269092.1 cell wall protein [Enterococcus hirae]MBA5277327.1 cell wall protein [Enterococcus hirae]